MIQFDNGPALSTDTAHVDASGARRYWYCQEDAAAVLAASSCKHCGGHDADGQAWDCSGDLICTACAIKICKEQGDDVVAHIPTTEQIETEIAYKRADIGTN